MVHLLENPSWNYILGNLHATHEKIFETQKRIVPIKTHAKIMNAQNESETVKDSSRWQISDHDINWASKGSIFFLIGSIKGFHEHQNIFTLLKSLKHVLQSCTHLCVCVCRERERKREWKVTPFKKYNITINNFTKFRECFLKFLWRRSLVKPCKQKCS